MNEHEIVQALQAAHGKAEETQQPVPFGFVDDQGRATDGVVYPDGWQQRQAAQARYDARQEARRTA